jgi:hypothetical protein
MYAYGYGYPITSSNGSQAFAGTQLNLLDARVTADSGTIVDRDFTYNLYRLCFDQFAGVVPRRLYSSNAAVKLNDLGGGDVRVQVMYDLNNASPVDAIQTTAANQPSWIVDADTGFAVPTFNGDKVFTIADLGILNAQQAGTIFAVSKDTNRTAGDASHNVVIIRPNTESQQRLAILSRLTTNIFASNGKVLDAATSASITQTSADGYHALSSIAVYVANTLVNYVDGVTASTTMAGAGTTSATDSSSITIGSNLTFTAKLTGMIGEIILDRTAFSVTQLSALRTFYKRYYPTLP